MPKPERLGRLCDTRVELREVEQQDLLLSGVMLDAPGTERPRRTRKVHRSNYNGWAACSGPRRPGGTSSCWWSFTQQASNWQKRRRHPAGPTPAMQSRVIMDHRTLFGADADDDHLGVGGPGLHQPGWRCPSPRTCMPSTPSGIVAPLQARLSTLQLLTRARSRWRRTRRCAAGPIQALVFRADRVADGLAAVQSPITISCTPGSGRGRNLGGLQRSACEPGHRASLRRRHGPGAPDVTSCWVHVHRAHHGRGWCRGLGHGRVRLPAQALARAISGMTANPAAIGVSHSKWRSSRAEPLEQLA